MVDECECEFTTVAASLGHDRSALATGHEIVTQLRLPTIEAIRATLSRAEPARRALRAPTFFDAIRDRHRLGQGMHDRGESIIWAEGALWDTDWPGINRHLPIRVKAISAATKIVPANTAWDVTTRGADWGIDELEELYVIVNIGTLVLEPGASVIVRGNVFTLVCQRLTRGVGSSAIARAADVAVSYDLGILSHPFPGGKPEGALHGGVGRNSAAGKDALPIVRPPLSSSLFGPIDWKGEVGSIDGAAGCPGEPGRRGGNGKSGGPTKLAEINIRDIDPAAGEVVVFAQPGSGGNGGRGGRGGDGGDGTAGGEGFRTLAGIRPGGRGGDGGAAGDGGPGGHGGHGGISSNIYICVPPDQESRIRRVALPGRAGLAGAGGEPGRPGHAGAGGDGPIDDTHGLDGSPGRVGHQGRDGHAGHDRPAPPMFLNERL
jgi:hypothetical protein